MPGLKSVVAAATLAATTALVPTALFAQSAGGEAQATVALNVRSGPSTGYRVVDVLSEGERVGVVGCQGGWCEIEHAGPDGFVSDTYLARVSSRPDRNDDGFNRYEGARARSTAALNVRSGPGTQYGVVDALYSGEPVTVGECQGSGWCRIEHDGRDGWVSSRYLQIAERSGNDRDQGRDRDGDGVIDDDSGISVSGPGFSFEIGIGANFDDDGRDRPARGGEVCFYEDWNYGGESFCATNGDRNRRLSDFNDRISSIRVRGDIEVQVCEDYGYGGRCAVIDQSRQRLNGNNNDIISSFRAR